MQEFFRAHARSFLLPLISVVTLCLAPAPRVDASGHGTVHVHGYYRRDGTYVQPHYRSAPDGNFRNNWSTVGNVNPYTGEAGTKSYPPASYGGEVHVNGYFRSDGTFVPPYYRSAPDGDRSNNWSTLGNINPYTGTQGTKSPELSAPSLLYPPIELIQIGLLRAGYNPGPTDGVIGPRTKAAYAHFVHAMAGERLTLDANLGSLAGAVRDSDSDLARQLDYLSSALKSDPQAGDGAPKEGPTWADPTKASAPISSPDAASRMYWAERLGEHGVPVDWTQHSASEMSDMNSRIYWADRLKEHGVDVDWGQHTASELSDMNSRIYWADRLRERGINVDWEQHTASKMSDMNSRIYWADRLRERGINVDWEQHTAYELSVMWSRLQATH